jgi:hypothetical protein
MSKSIFSYFTKKTSSSNKNELNDNKLANEKIKNCNNNNEKKTLL